MRRADSRASSPTKQLEMEPAPDMVTEEEAAARAEEQLALARAAWEKEQQQLEKERQHAEQVLLLTT